jgi:nitrite reductase/ring-hydroxylating ferredoxin subunit
MNTLDHSYASAAWAPAMASLHVPRGQIVPALLHGQELALWRDAQGKVQAWDNRCPHRGMRFTMGRIVDDQLSCAYHGWRFGSGGQCTAIPAHPGMTPPRTIGAKSFPVTERSGMVWIALQAPEGDAPTIRPLADAGRRALFCRSFLTYASAEKVSVFLRDHSSFSAGRHGATALIDSSDPEASTVLLLHPMAENKCIAHLWLSCRPGADEQALIQNHIAQFKRWRRDIEAATVA